MPEGVICHGTCYVSASVRSWLFKMKLLVVASACFVTHPLDI